MRFLDSCGKAAWSVANGDAPARLLKGSPWDGIHATDEPADTRHLLAPVEPPNILAIGLNYADHAVEGGRTPPAEPLVFLKATSAVIGPGQAIALPDSAPDEVDYEAELVVVIGRTARNVTRRDAVHHVAGFTCGNDVTARDCQRRRDKQWARAKSFDTFAPVGPWLVTPDEFDPENAEIRSEVNGEVRQRAAIRDMLFPWDELVSYLSRQFTLLPGTAIFTGTPAGVGFARNPPSYLKRGDEVTVTITGIGSLTNPVA